MKPDEVIQEVRETTANILWRQWKGLGAMTNAREAQAIVDPEALLFASLAFSEIEPRVVEIVRSWIWENAESISIQRIKNLRKEFPGPDALDTIAQLAVESGDIRWKKLLKAGSHGTTQGRPKGRTIATPLQATAALMVRMRAGFGHGARADLLTYLIGLSNVRGESWASVASMAHALSYTVTNVRQSADEMARAGFIEQLPGTSGGRGATARMFRVRAGMWQGLLGGGNPRWHDWKETFRFALEFDRIVRAAPAGSITEYVIWSHFRELLGKFPAALPSDNSALERLPVDADEWPAYVDERIRDWKSWVENRA